MWPSAASGRQATGSARSSPRASSHRPGSRRAVLWLRSEVAARAAPLLAVIQALLTASPVVGWREDGPVEGDVAFVVEFVAQVHAPGRVHEEHMRRVLESASGTIPSIDIEHGDTGVDGEVLDGLDVSSLLDELVD